MYQIASLRIVVVLLAFTLSACADKWDSERARGLANTGLPFNQTLQAEYAALAKAEQAEDDWRDVAYFVARAQQAAGSADPVAPQPLGDRKIPPEAMEVLSTAHQRLGSVLSREGATRAPVETARAQAMLECWMQEQEENHQPTDIAACRDAFETALAAASDKLLPETFFVVLPNDDGSAGAISVETDAGSLLLDKPLAAAKIGAGKAAALDVSDKDVEQSFGSALAARPIPPSRFVLYFVEGTVELVAESKAAYQGVFSDIARRPVAEVEVVAHTDRLGSNEDNHILSMERARAIRGRLIADGIDPDFISAAGRGELDPIVATANGVREPRNRRVEIVVR